MRVDELKKYKRKELMEIAKRFELKIISIEDLIAYRMQNETLIEELVEIKLPTKFGDFKLKAFKQLTTTWFQACFFGGYGRRMGFKYAA